MRGGECYREGDAEREHGPVCRVVEARPPDRAAVNLSAIEMRKRANRGCVELLGREAGVIPSMPSLHHQK